MKKSTFYRAIGGKNSPLVSDFAQALANWDKSLNEVHSDDGHIIVTEQGSLHIWGVRATPDVSQIRESRAVRLVWSELKQILSPENLGGLVLSDEQVSDLSPMARISLGYSVMNADELRDKALVKWAKDEETGLAALCRLMDRVFDATQEEDKDD